MEASGCGSEPSSTGSLKLDSPQVMDSLASSPEVQDDCPDCPSGKQPTEENRDSDSGNDDEDDDKCVADGDEQLNEKYYDCSDVNIPEGESSLVDPGVTPETVAKCADDDDTESSMCMPTSVSIGEQCKPLKSILRTSSSRKNKGLKVSFHDARIFFIDMDAQVTVEQAQPQPQLLTVRAFDLPLALTEFSVLTPSSFDSAPSLPPGSYEGGRHYTYEDAIVSFDDDGDTLVCHSAQPPPLPCDDLDIANDFGRESEVSNLDCPLLSALQQESLANGAVDGEPKPADTCNAGNAGNADKPLSKDSLTVGLQSLTEANLKQHEILMEKSEEDNELNLGFVGTGSGGTSEEMFHLTASSGNSLSPPLKELTVDVQDLPSGNDASDDWQVELSPLNSIPESETGSSTSSQDTIIMMTSDESRRNEEHIQLSTDIYRKVKQGSDDVSTVEQPEGDVVDDVGAELQQRNSDQIRDILERNAVRRNHLRYNVKKKFVIDGVPVEKQRQWRSHESLLDTIKKLTLDDDIVEDDSSYLTSANGASAISLDGNLDTCQNDEIVRDASQESDYRLSYPREPNVPLESAEVPKDLRQWKIRSNMWNSLNGAAIGKRNFMKRLGDVDGQSSLAIIADGFVAADHHHYHQLPQPPSSSASVNNGMAPDDASDELLQFVTQDSERIERIRRRYSYTDGGGDYEAVGAFARRPSVRGIKTRFGSTTEILSQMQNHRQSSLSNHACSHITWPYPLSTATQDVSTLLNVNRRKPKRSDRLPLAMHDVQEDVESKPCYSVTAPSAVLRIPAYSNNNEYQPVFRTRRGHGICYVSSAAVQQNSVPSHQSLLPPPYQPPPAPSYAASASTSGRNVFQVRGERGVPEGASSSIQGPFDSVYRSQNQSQESDKVVNMQAESKFDCKKEQFQQEPSGNSGYVYYAMQV